MAETEAASSPTSKRLRNILWRSISGLIWVSQILFVADLLQPFDDLAVERLLNGEVRHCRGRRGAVPMLFMRRAPDHVARSNFHFGSSIALHPPAPGRDDQRLPKRMRMPSTVGSRLERDLRTARASRVGCLEQRVNANRAGEILVRSLAGRLRTILFDLHFLYSSTS